MDGRKPLRIELVTSGGFSGRGVGSIKIDGTNVTADDRVSAELTADELARLDRLPILKSLPVKSVTPDAIVYTLIVDGRRWMFGDRDVPPDYANWATALLDIRRRVVDQTSSSM